MNKGNIRQTLTHSDLLSQNHEGLQIASRSAKRVENSPVYSQYALAEKIERSNDRMQAKYHRYTFGITSEKQMRDARW